ncbi:uncharacterized protein BX663DRAFT_542300 [Cokeromyces recurvatus]|uniref:uncharacterized protein n=1 Tax=Cokeromyces recurvatus TaxID=90255 RepID=UPI00221FC544|nr:uncharacterized protein BX663DRAFT_542300 [Cokeromyces recurvatus]KAI7904002.1 hypothetical protein BX663DRAFT_542300 [Cokeromyces recurvatus]
MMITETTAFSHPFNFNDIQRVHPLSASPAPSAFFRTTSPVQSTNTMDDVTTIFVVGFPDDMSEREFQNMFTFCQGFEAASLKWHCKEQEEENIGGKKQMIGFARFRTRLEALEAIDVLSGKRIDQEKGTMLKAEMAKKNLHIKRGSTTQTTSSSSSSSSSTSTTIAPQSQLQLQPPPPPPPPPPPISSSSTTTTTSSSNNNNSNTFMMTTSLTMPDSLKNMHQRNYPPHLPSDLFSPQDYKNDLFIEPSIISPTLNDSFFGIRSSSFDHHDLGFISSNRAFGLIPTNEQQHNHLHSHYYPPHHHHFMNEQENRIDSNSYHYLSKLTPSIHDNKILEQELLRLSLLSSNQQELRLNPKLTANPADQNPPCNTLYVGNLPLNTLEDELRHLFSNCRGYRRMCFRTKSQGPMCFVEFEDIGFASQALNDLQGQKLSNSIKGGIRLSFSKNPLFIKPNKENNMMTHFKPMGNILMTDRRGSSSNRDLMFDPQL